MRYWLVDGHRQMRFVRDDDNTRTTVETRELWTCPNVCAIWMPWAPQCK